MLTFQPPWIQWDYQTPMCNVPGPSAAMYKQWVLGHLELEVNSFFNEGPELLTHLRQVLANTVHQILTIIFQLSINGSRCFCWLCLRLQTSISFPLEASCRLTAASKIPGQLKLWLPEQQNSMTLTVLYMKIFLKFIF